MRSLAVTYRLQCNTGFEICFTPTIFIQVRDLIYREILEYHPQMLADHLSNGMSRGANFMYPSAVDNFRRQCAPLP